MSDERGCLSCCAGCGCMMAVCMLAMSALTIGPHLDRDAYVGTVTEKRIERRIGPDRYKVSVRLEDGSVRVLENRSSVLELKFGSYRTQKRLVEGRKYRIETYGWNVPLLSWHDNILGAEEVP
ncbi:MAG: hypothetical protein HYW25_00205 [Candidatus Aenigmarchaeota archaeon]|nr:hypothetical protein [Candidatus Aenigmarchaeota archaeon]